MQKLTIYSIERETDSGYRFSIRNFDERKLWKIAYKKEDGKSGMSWAEGDDELAAFVNFKNTKVSAETFIKDKFEIVLGEGL